MNELIDSVVAFQNLLEKEGIPTMASGGIAVGIWGEPRLTRDIDMKVLIHREDRAHLLAVLRAFTPLDDNPDDSFRRLGLAFFHDSNGVRIDVLLADTVFDRDSNKLPEIKCTHRENYTSARRSRKHDGFCLQNQAVTC